MPLHRFRVGDTVRIVRSVNTDLVDALLNKMSAIRTHQPKDTWEVTRLLPPENIGYRYHVQGRHSGPARLVLEMQLEPA